MEFASQTASDLAAAELLLSVCQLLRALLQSLLQLLYSVTAHTPWSSSDAALHCLPLGCFMMAAHLFDVACSRSMLGWNLRSKSSSPPAISSSLSCSQRHTTTRQELHSLGSQKVTFRTVHVLQVIVSQTEHTWQKSV